MQGFKGLLADLDALFGAEIARQEDEAADDLAVSLKADRHLVEVLADGSFDIAMGERTVAIDSVGRDFVQGGEFLVPFGRYHFIASSGGRTRSTDLSFVDCLRSIARAKVDVELGLGARTLQGVLSSVAPDHLVVGERAGSVVVPLGSVSWVRFSPEDSTGVS